MLAVLIIGLLMTIYAMTPARKAPGRRNWYPYRNSLITHKDLFIV